jgi:hypothetical protein
MKRENNEALSEMPPPKRGSPASLGAPVWRMRSSDQVFANSADRQSMLLLDVRPMTKGALRGFCRVQLPSRLVVQDVAVFVGRKRAWANLPAKAWIAQDNRHKTDINGKPAYLPVFEWGDGALADRFSERAIALIRRAHPGDLAD